MIVYGMHIMEGFLPLKWVILWWVALMPFLVLSIKRIQERIKKSPQSKLLLAMAGSFIFVLSALKLPSITGSSSHPTGVGFGAILFGPFAMVVISFIVLIFQALLLAHGGITTLGANGFSMGVVGAIVAYGIYKVFKKANLPTWFTVFFAATMGNMATYFVTAAQLALGHPDPTGGFLPSFIKFIGVFSFTQIPLAVIEGLLTAIVFNMLSTYRLNDSLDLTI